MSLDAIVAELLHLYTDAGPKELEEFGVERNDLLYLACSYASRELLNNREAVKAIITAYKAGIEMERNKPTPYPPPAPQPTIFPPPRPPTLNYDF